MYCNVIWVTRKGFSLSEKKALHTVSEFQTILCYVTDMQFIVFEFIDVCDDFETRCMSVGRRALSRCTSKEPKVAFRTSARGVIAGQATLWVLGVSQLIAYCKSR